MVYWGSTAMWNVQNNNTAPDFDENDNDMIVDGDELDDTQRDLMMNQNLVITIEYVPALRVLRILVNYFIWYF